MAAEEAHKSRTEILRGDGAEKCPIQKSLISASKSPYAEFPYETKVLVHFRVRALYEEEPLVLDDSRQSPKKEPLELIIGKKFKFELLEECVKTMGVGEVARFVIDKKKCTSYPEFAQAMRDVWSGAVRAHSCGMSALQEITGRHRDLYQYMKTPVNLELTLELIDRKLPGQFERDAWYMRDDDKLQSIEPLRLRGNEHYGAGRHEAALREYGEALRRLEALALAEKPQGAEHQKLTRMRVPLLNNAAQCQLITGDFYEALKLTDEALDIEPDNVKALYRRGRARLQVGEYASGRQDLTRCAQLDADLQKTVERLLDDAESERKRIDRDDSLKYKKAFATK